MSYASEAKSSKLIPNSPKKMKPGDEISTMLKRNIIIVTRA
jgi:hypothetical protein